MIPERPKIYHILHLDVLSKILSSNCLLCDAEVQKKGPSSVNIGIEQIKKRRLESKLPSHPELCVGECVPFYFCPRSVMLYLIYKGNHPQLSYRDGQESIVHIEADLYNSLRWAQDNQRRWAFTLSNAGSRYFEDRSNINDLKDLNWEAIMSDQWSNPKIKEGKQAEFLMEHSFPLSLIERLGVKSNKMLDLTYNLLYSFQKNLSVRTMPEWYY
ncbi:type II toxin-antitoxin system toxin DNA ADP-ribosyl transferase DarT [Dethiosulfovibrio salsuginis]|uniref:DarT domain-containing protein n=1 Tax=Dethiosulfovibrio salsuginis TaxID=561720 RepID=A0A1X7L420_9BACT|nr:protein of unknown function [Dethiosulfovibrio salsuginis]